MKSVIFSVSLLALMACGEEEKTEGMTAGDCTDGADNDGDGDFDCNDDGCAGSPDCQERDTADTNSGDTADTNSEDTSSTTDPLDIDDDGDGFTENDGDCDDTDSTIFTGAEDSTVDGIDQDCNGFDGTDNDGDGFADADAGGTDCNDSDSTINPEAEEDFTDGIDQDCDGYADVSNVQCSADLTITFPNEETVTLDFCQNWSMESTFEYDPDVPPQLNSMFVELNATNDSDFDCRLRFRRTGICNDGYYRLGTNEEGRPYFYQGTFISWFESTLGNQEELILETMDCLGVSDENEMTAGFEQGWLRIDSINTGTEAGSFANTPLSTEIQGKLNVWSASGLSLVGNIQLSSTQIASDQEENICDKVSDERVNADWDGDGFINPYFEGNDCDDRHYPIMLGGGAISGATAFPGSAENDSLTECMKDADGDGYGDPDFRVYWHQDGYWMSGSGVFESGSSGTDCNDSSAEAFPGNTVDVPFDGIDGDCDILTPNPGFIQISAGRTHSCGLDTQGYITCWGSNVAGSVSGPNTTQSTFTHIVAGYDYTCALDTNNGASCFGGYSGFSSVSSFGTSFGTSINLADGLDAMCSLSSSGGVTCLGWEYQGQISNAPTDSNYIDISGATGDVGFCALDSTGTPLCWGDSSVSSPNTGGGFIEITKGHSHACVLDATGLIDCWGNANQLTGIPSGSGFTKVAAGDGVTCAIDSIGFLNCWGTSNLLSGVPTDSGYIDVNFGDEHACALRGTGVPYCWGNDGNNRSTGWQ